MPLITYGWRVQGLDGSNYVSQQVAHTPPRQTVSPRSAATAPAAPTTAGAPTTQARPVVGAATTFAPKREIPWSHIFVGLAGGMAGYYLAKRNSSQEE